MTWSSKPGISMRWTEGLTHRCRVGTAVAMWNVRSQTTTVEFAKHQPFMVRGAAHCAYYCWYIQSSIVLIINVTIAIVIINVKTPISHYHMSLFLLLMAFLCGWSPPNGELTRPGNDLTNTSMRFAFPGTADPSQVRRQIFTFICSPNITGQRCVWVVVQISLTRAGTWRYNVGLAHEPQSEASSEPPLIIWFHANHHWYPLIRSFSTSLSTKPEARKLGDLTFASASLSSKWWELVER